MIHGPGAVPLYVQAFTTLPGLTSQLVMAAVRSNCFVPSARTVGRNRVLAVLILPAAYFLA